MIILFVLLALERSAREFMARLYEDYKDPMWRYAFTIARDRDMADDVVHSAFASLIRKAELLRELDPRELDAYITITVKRQALQTLRGEGYHLSLELMEEPADLYEGPADFSLRMVEYGAVREAVKALPEHYRDVICLRYLDNEEYSDIADTMGTTEGNARVMACRARSRIKATLDAWGASG